MTFAQGFYLRFYVSLCGLCLAIAKKSTHLGLRAVRWRQFALVCRRRDHQKPLGLLRQALLAFAGAVSKVLDGLFHAQRYIGELIEVFGQVAG